MNCKCQWCGVVHHKGLKRSQRAAMHFCSPECHKRRRAFAATIRHGIKRQVRKHTAKTKRDRSPAQWEGALLRCASIKNIDEWTQAFYTMSGVARDRNLAIHYVRNRKTTASCAKNRRQKHGARNAMILASYKSGTTHRMNAKAFGLSKQYVERLVRKLKNPETSAKTRKQPNRKSRMGWGSALSRIVNKWRKPQCTWSKRLNNLASNHRKRMMTKQARAVSRSQH